MEAWTKELREEGKYVLTHLLARGKWSLAVVVIGLGVGIVGKVCPSWPPLRRFPT